MVKNDTVKKSLRARKSPEELQLCPAIGFGRVVGGKYKLRILWLLNKRTHRYGELRGALVRGSMGAEPTPRVLSRELKELQERGLVSRRQYDVVPPKVEYSLTERGRELIPVIAAIIDWGLTGAHEEILGITPADATIAATSR